MEASEAGIVGVYQPDPQSIADLINSNSKLADESVAESGGASARRRLLTISNATGAEYVGIAQPTVCLSYGETIMFSVSNNYYPVYDK